MPPSAVSNNPRFCWRASVNAPHPPSMALSPSSGAAADELYRDAGISDRTWAGLAERYDTALLMSAVFTASSYRATSMALNALGVQIEPGNERFPTGVSR